MTKLGPYEVHPFADAFPLMEGDEFDNLVRDIKANGLRQPITLTHDGAILVDGRNRYRACEAASADPVFERLGDWYTPAQLLDLIVSSNLERRHLNPGQRAALALRYEGEIAKLTPTGAAAHSRASKASVADLRHLERKSSAKAAKMTGASARGVQQAKAVERDAPDLLARVESGELALDSAAKQAKARAAAKPKAEPAPKPAPVMLTLRTHAGEEVAYPKSKAKAKFNETKGDGISWAAWSWNPVTGCLHGCDYCYAREIATSPRFADAYPAGFTPLFHEERLGAPANTTIPSAHRDNPSYRRVFVCSMADLYGRWVPDEWIQRVHESMLATPDWQYILLTKFPARYVGLDLPPRAWVGTSVDEQKRVRIAEDAFRKVDGDGIKRWLSLEPLREPLEFSDLSMFDWVVIGGQTTTTQPDGVVIGEPLPLEWFARIYLQAKDAGCKVHIKPNIKKGPPGLLWPDEYPGD